MEIEGLSELERAHLFKALGPISASTKSEIERIQALDISRFSEADVREEIITPVVRLIGYAKDTIFSLEREKSLRVLGKHSFIDYNFTLWKENFWLIEAKKPKKRGFSHRDLLQAVQYATHPEINAALVVLCDGNRIEIFDREVTLEKPLLCVAREDLWNDFDKLRMLLDPWQVWFFEKRRVARLIDKVFEKELNLSRLDEFGFFIKSRILSKRSLVLENFRSNVNYSKDHNARLKYLRAASTSELIDVHFFFSDNLSAMKTIVGTLINRSGGNIFGVLNQIFPSQPRSANSSFYAYALMFLIEAESNNCRVSWLPAYLKKTQAESSLNDAIEMLIKNCVTHFCAYEGQNIILLFSSAIRRVHKILMITRSDRRSMGEFLHAFERYTSPEISWSQIVSSPDRHLLLHLDKLQIIATERFVEECSKENLRFFSNISKARLRELWKTEIKLLQNAKEYHLPLREYDLGETHPTEFIDTVYDYLGHSALCVLEHYPKWKEYTLNKHLSEIGTLSNIGSWQARKWLNLSIDSSSPKLLDQVFADRFFLGDIEVYRSLAQLYGYDIETH